MKKYFLLACILGGLLPALMSYLQPIPKVWIPITYQSTLAQTLNNPNALNDQEELEQFTDSEMKISPLQFAGFMVGLFFIMAVISFVLYRRYSHVIVEQKLKEFDLKRSERYFKELYEKTPAMFHASDKEGKLLNVSKKWLETLGYRHEEVVGNKYTDFMTAQSKNIAEKEVIPRLLTAGKVESESFQFVKKSGELVDVLLSASVETDAAGNIRQSIAYLNDVTEQIKTEEALRKSEAKVLNQLAELNQIYDLSPVGLALIDKELRFIRINKQLADITGRTVEDHIGKTVEEIMPNLIQEQKLHFRSIMKKGDPVLNDEIQGVDRKNPKVIRHWIGNYLPLKNQHGEVEGMIAGILEITDRKKEEREMLRAKEEAESANSAKDQFLANMSHELKTPLNAIIGFSQILINKSETNGLPFDLIDLINNIKLGGQELSELLDNLLEFSKINIGETTTTKEPVNLENLILSVCNINQAIAEKNKINFSYKIENGVPASVLSDGSKMHKILMNLISNAIKFSKKNKNVELNVSTNDQQLVLKIVDQGIGIAEDSISSIFEAFEQADKSSTRKFGGSGLGLSIVKKHVQALGGEIKVNSKEDEGTTFTVFLPLEQAEGEFQLIERQDSETIFSSDNKILVVEDNQINQELMRSFFSEIGLAVEIAENGYEGIKKTEEMIPDLVLMDIHMPRMDGMQAIKEIRSREEFEHIPVLALSADATKEKKKKAMKEGFNGYLLKPFDLDDLIPYLDQYLKKRVAPATTKTTSIEALPPEIQEQVCQKFRQLSKIPRDYSNEIIDRIDAIRELVQPYQSDHCGVLQEIENAVYECDDEKLESLIIQQLEMSS